MKKRQRSQLFVMCNEENIARYYKPAHPKLDQSFERDVEIGLSLAFRTWSSRPSVRAAICKPLEKGFRRWDWLD